MNQKSFLSCHPLVLCYHQKYVVMYLNIEKHSVQSLFPLHSDNKEKAEPKASLTLLLEMITTASLQLPQDSFCCYCITCFKSLQNLVRFSYFIEGLCDYQVVCLYSHQCVHHSCNVEKQFIQLKAE